MTTAQKFIEQFKLATGKSLCEGYPDTATFKNVLDAYESYYKSLAVAQQLDLSIHFWNVIKSIGTPIIEERPDGQAQVYFLFPRNDKHFNPEKDLCLQGDFHGYGYTNQKSQALQQLGVTDIMFRSDTLDKDAVVTYYYISLDPKHRNKSPLDFYGSALEPLPEHFFREGPENPAVLQTENRSQEANEIFWGEDNAFQDEYSKYQKIYQFYSSVFCANPTNDLSHLNLPFDNEEKPGLIYKKEQKNIKGIKLSLASVGDEVVAYDGTSAISQYTRSIDVFAPNPPGKIDQVVIVNDGRYYQAVNTYDSIIEQLGENTAVIFINPQDGMFAFAQQNNVQFDDSDNLPGMGARVVDYKYRPDEYVEFIDQKLFKYLNDNNIKIPSEPSQRILIGSSASGTASIYMGMKYPQIFGKVVAQSPSPSNRRILQPLIATNKKAPPPDIFLSCGKYECPEHAGNFNLPYANELAKKIGLGKPNVYPHGHQMDPWAAELKISLPALCNANKKANSAPAVNSTVSQPITRSRHLHANSKGSEHKITVRSSSVPPPTTNEPVKTRKRSTSVPPPRPTKL